jgi:hypothetical protein
MTFSDPRRPRLGLVVLATLVSVTLLVPVPAHARLPRERTWRTDVAQAMAGSQRFLERRAESGGRMAINLDIDNTALATEYDPGDATPRVLRFARKAHRLDMAVLFNTARHRSDVRRTARVLRRAGYTVDDICGRRSGESVVHSKKRCRRGFRADGFELVANVGNNPTDFRGGGYDRAYRLPSYGGRLS